MRRLIPIVLFGCAVENTPMREVDVQPFKIKAMELKDLQELYYRNYGNRNVLGFFQYENRTMYVPYSSSRDDCGDRLIDFEVLGHELSHLPEINGSFHDGKCPKKER